MTKRPLLCSALALCLTASLPQSGDAGSGLPANVVTGEVLDGWVTSSGTRMAALRLELAPGWKTYWRAPGDSGIPPSFSWGGSKNLRGISYHWPSPSVFSAYGTRTIGYKQELVLPIELHPTKPGEPIHLQGTMDLGVCETICVPAHLNFNSEMSGDGTSDPAIHLALASRPLPAKRAGVTGVTCKIDPISDGLHLRASISMPDLPGEEVALVEAGDPRIWVSEPEVRRNGDVLEVQADLVPPSGKPMALERSALRFTVIAGTQSVDIRGCTSN